MDEQKWVLGTHLVVPLDAPAYGMNQKSICAALPPFSGRIALQTFGVAEELADEFHAGCGTGPTA